MASEGRLRGAGIAFRVGAIVWSVHCGSVVAFGVLLVAITRGGFSGSMALVAAAVVPLVAISTASAGGLAFGLGLRALVRRSVELMAPSSEARGTLSTNVAIPRTARRNGGTAAFLCFVYAAIGVVSTVTILLLGANFLSASTMWFLASVVIGLGGVYGGDFLERFLPSVGIYGDPFQLLTWFAALTAVFSNWLLLALFLFGGPIGLLFLALPFGLCPLVGIAAFRRVHYVGSRLVRGGPRSPVAAVGSGSSADHTGDENPSIEKGRSA